MTRRLHRILFAFLFGSLLSTGIALAHGGGGLRGAAPDRFVVPTWLFIVTGGGVVGVSFLLASLFTDHDLIAELHAPYNRFNPNLQTLHRVGSGVGVVVLAVVVVTGFLAPNDPLQNLGILIVWVAWWAGFTISVYLVGNPWPAIDPFRAIARYLPESDGSTDLSTDQAAWLGALGLVALFGVEVISPLSENGPLLAIAVIGYLGVTLIGTRFIGFDTWFEYVDPLSRVFEVYGAVAPLGRDDDGTIVLRLPGAGLAKDILSGQGGVSLVVALVWGTTYDGLVSTPFWSRIATTVVEAGVPALLLYLGVLVLGYGFFLGIYRVSTAAMRRVAPTYLSTDTLARRFAPSLVAIAAGYHIAHNLTYFLALVPALGYALMDPLSPAAVSPLSLPTWVTYLPVAFVLLGHLAAVLVAHAVTFELMPGRLQAIRSQYPLTVVMILYTMTSLWIVSQPTVTPPFL